MFFEENKKSLKDLINEKYVIMNTISTLCSDLNIKNFLETFSEKANSIENLEHMESFYFKKNVIEYQELINLLFHASFKSQILKEHDPEEIIKRARVLHDSAGKNLMYFIGFLPLLNLTKDL